MASEVDALVVNAVHVLQNPEDALLNVIKRALCLVGWHNVRHRIQRHGMGSAPYVNSFLCKARK
jgi:hypothetical protein